MCTHFYIWCHFPYAWRLPFNSSCSSGLLAMNPFSFFISGFAFVFEIRFHGCFSPLRMSFHCFSPSLFPVRNWLSSLFCSSAHDVSFFLWLLLGLFLYRWFWAIWLCCPLDRLLHLSYAWGSLRFLDLWVHGVPQIWKDFGLFRYFFLLSPHHLGLQLNLYWAAWRHPTVHRSSLFLWFFSLSVSFQIISIAVIFTFTNLFFGCV